MSGSQRKALLAALCAAFDQNSFDQMLRHRLDKDRQQVAGAGNLRTVVFNVIEVAVREGWQAELIQAAISDNPGNPALQRFRKENSELASDGVEGSQPLAGIQPQRDPLTNALQTLKAHTRDLFPALAGAVRAGQDSAEAEALNLTLRKVEPALRTLKREGLIDYHYAAPDISQDTLNKVWLYQIDYHRLQPLIVKTVPNPLHRIIDLLTEYHRAWGRVDQANTREAMLTALDEWRSCHPAVWESSSARDDTIRTLADPAKEWLSQLKCPYVLAEDFNLVEEGARILSAFAVSPSPMSMPEVYSKAYSTEDELWHRWERQGDRYMALGGLIARLKELAARAGQKWNPSPQAK